MSDNGRLSACYIPLSSIMPLASRLQYYRRIVDAYFLRDQSHLTFWHDSPQVNQNAPSNQIGEYYMPFLGKADYRGPHDSAGIPLLDYRGAIGLQYNPIAISQWGLGNFNFFLRTGEENRKDRFLRAANWLCDRLEQNSFGVWVWNHQFDWEYRNVLKAPWYSGLAQGQGISLLVRAAQASGERRYMDAAQRAFGSFLKRVHEGGVTVIHRDDIWFEEYVVDPPTHILNGFMWAIWGVYDYFLATRDGTARQLFKEAVHTLGRNLACYDLGFWSLYERSGTLLPMIASPFYHRLHIAQLKVMYLMTGDEVFARYADRWQHYIGSRAKRTRAFCYKSVFKLCYY
jgi:heparosan-N-sulfate-glucuronate 5-epimerase